MPAKRAFSARTTIAQRRAGEAQQTQRFGPDTPLHQAEFAVVADAFELQHEIAVVQVGMRRSDQHPCRRIVTSRRSIRAAMV